MYPVELITEEGEIVKGIIYDDGEFEECKIEAKYIATPTFFNSHTHLLDSIAEVPNVDLISAMEFKFKILNKFEDDEIREGVERSVKIAMRSGTSSILNFTEMGLRGYKIIKDFNILSLTRPSNIEEAEILVDKSIGFGMSSIRDHDYRFLEELRNITKRKGKIFAIHAGEVDDEDVEGALALEPDLIIHMNMASVKNLKRAMDEGIPIVTCMRSNAFFGLLNKKNYEILSEYDKWLIGTDNAMVCKPSMLEEMRFASYVLRKDLDVFKACIRGFEFFGGSRGLIIFNRKFNLHLCKDSLKCVIRRAETIDIEKIISKS